MKKEYFKNPETVAAYGEAQSPLWFWNDKLETEELERQLQLMTEKGVTCNAPHARAGYEGGYLDENWNKHIRTVVEYKKKHKETMWLYDEFNWPSGIAGGEVTRNEDYREKYLTLNRFYVPANTRFRIQPVPLRKSESSSQDQITMTGKIRIDNIFAYDAETMEKLDIRSFQPDDTSGILFNLSEFDFELLRDRDTIVFEAKVGTELFKREGYFDPDYLNEDATKKFIDITYETYYREFSAAFGDVITASFDDETRFCHAFPWTDKLLQAFEERYGYCLEKCIPDLVLPGREAGRTRCDYFNLLADLFRQNYHQVLREWCEGHGIDYCPHLLGEESVAAQVRYAGDLMRQFREVTRPGVDHLGKGIGSLNIRFVSSAAEVYGKRGLICEVFAACGWDLTFEEYIRMVSWLYSQGVETITNHGFFYSTRDFRANDWPPSEFFQWKGWDRMQEANAMCRRFYGMVQESQRSTDVLIYHPVETFWLHYIADQNFTHGFHRGPYIQDEQAARIDQEEQILLNRLQEENRDFTIFPGDAVEQFEVRDGKLINKNTALTYSAFVLPMCEVLPLEAAKLLEEFVTQGGKLYLMDAVPSYGMKKEDDAALQAIMKNLMASANVRFSENMNADLLMDWLNQVAPQRLEILRGRKNCKKTWEHYPGWLIDPYIHTGEDVTGVSWTKFEGEETKYYFVNHTGTVQELELRVCSKTVPEIWDTMTGEIREAEQIGKKEDEQGDWFRIKLELPANYGVFLVISENDNAAV